MRIYLFIIALFLLCSCSKETATPVEIVPVPPAAVPENLFIEYIIARGGHYSDKTGIKPFAGTLMRLNVKFDSSAIYTNRDPANQADINKLVGFTEGTDNHVNSARFGWGWSNNALRLYAYSYASGVRRYKEIAMVNIGVTVSLTLSIQANEYIFKVDEKLVTLPRTLASETVVGYWQYPYFGGDETAPHDIHIFLQYL